MLCTSPHSPDPRPRPQVHDLRRVFRNRAEVQLAVHLQLLVVVLDVHAVQLLLIVRERVLAGLIRMVPPAILELVLPDGRFHGCAAAGDGCAVAAERAVVLEFVVGFHAGGSITQPGLHNACCRTSGRVGPMGILESEPSTRRNGKTRTWPRTPLAVNSLTFTGVQNCHGADVAESWPRDAGTTADAGRIFPQSSNTCSSRRNDAVTIMRIMREEGAGSGLPSMDRRADMRPRRPLHPPRRVMTKWDAEPWWRAALGAVIGRRRVEPLHILRRSASCAT